MGNLLVAMPVTTSLGIFTARYSNNGLAELNFPNAAIVATPQGTADEALLSKVKKWHRVTEMALLTALSGKRPVLPPLDWNGATDFQKAVWRQMLKIIPGETKSYGEIARAIRRPKAVRAVGSACGANPIPVLVPCHRVLAANKRIGGFGGGLERKRQLLAIEGVTLP